MSLGADTKGISAFDMARRLSNMTATAIPKQITALETKDVLHEQAVGKDAMRDAVLSVL